MYSLCTHLHMCYFMSHRTFVFQRASKKHQLEYDSEISDKLRKTRDDTVSILSGHDGRMVSACDSQPQNRGLESRISQFNKPSKYGLSWLNTMVTRYTHPYMSI